MRIRLGCGLDSRIYGILYRFVDSLLVWFYYKNMSRCTVIRMSYFEIKDIQYQNTMSKNRYRYRYTSYRLCWLLASLITLASSQQTCMTYTYCCVYSARLLMMDRDTVRNMYSHIPKNKFEKLVLLVGFITRIYHDARSSEYQIMKLKDIQHQNTMSSQLVPFTSYWPVCWVPQACGGGEL